MLEWSDSQFKAPPELERIADEVKRGVRCPTGEARITEGCKLPARYVIHTVGPVYRNAAASEPLLAQIRLCLVRLAEDFTLIGRLVLVNLLNFINRLVHVDVAGSDVINPALKVVPIDTAGHIGHGSLGLAQLVHFIWR